MANGLRRSRQGSSLGLTPADVSVTYRDATDTVSCPTQLIDRLPGGRQRHGHVPAHSRPVIGQTHRPGFAELDDQDARRAGLHEPATCHHLPTARSVVNMQKSSHHAETAPAVRCS